MIVIGAGVGGLTAAATLVKAGRRVLVLDRNPHPGGTAYVFTRKGFIFPMGPLGFSTPALVRQILADLGRDKDMDFRQVHYQIKAFGVDILLSQSFDRLANDLKKTFPEDACGLETFFRDTADIIAAMGSPQEKNNAALLEQTAKTSAAEYFKHNVTNWKLQKVLGSLGTHEPYGSMALVAAMWNLMVNQGIWYPEGGMRSFCHRLVQAVAENGNNQNPLGEIRMGAEVKAIHVQHGKVAGILLADGNQVRTEKVISNADFKTTFLKLVDPGMLPDQWRQGLARAKQTGSVFQVCLGLDTSKADLSAFSQASRLLYRRAGEASGQSPRTMDWMANEVDPEALAGQELEMSLLSKEDPALAPKGGHVLAIRTEADHGHFSHFRSPAKTRAPFYKHYKMRLAQALIGEAGKVVSGLQDAVQVVDVATPLTFEDQGGRSEGAVAGWSWDYEDTTDYEPAELIRTPIHGLFMAGYQAYSNLFMGGVPTAMVSGQKAAEYLLAGAGPTVKLKIPGDRV